MPASGQCHCGLADPSARHQNQGPKCGPVYLPLEDNAAAFRTSHSFQITVVKPTFSAVWLVPKCHHNTHGLLTTENKLLFPMSKVHYFVKIVSNLCHLLVLEITSNLCCFCMYKWYQLTSSSVGPLVLVIFWGEEGLTLDRNSNGSI